MNKTFFTIICLLLLALLGFVQCAKDGDPSQQQQEPDMSDTTYGGGGATDCSYPELDVAGLPTLSWVLDGSMSNYQPYASNRYFRFRSKWLAGGAYECGGQQKVHNGWDVHRPDFAAIAGTKVYAAYAGTVKAVYNAGNGFAQGITIEHTDLLGNKFTTNYTHVDAANNLQNKPVAAGDEIGTVADLAANDHLHFSLRRSPYTTDDVPNRGALPKYNNDNNCSCDGDPVFPEYFVDPGKLSFNNRNVSPITSRVIALTGSLNFGSVTIGTTAQRNLTITNTGNADLTVSSISVPSNFSASWSGTIAPNSSQSVTVSFTPTQASAYSGSLQVQSNATSGQSTISVNGTGTNTPPSGPSSNPAKDIYVACPGTILGTGLCNSYTYSGGEVKMRVVALDAGSITFEVDKCTVSNGFQQAGTVYIKEGDYCGAVVATKGYTANSSSVVITVNTSFSGTKMFTCVIDPDNQPSNLRYNGGSIIVTY